MKKLILILIVNTLLIGCASNDTINKARNDILIQRDTTIRMAEISGFRIDMSPRKVASIAVGLKLRESKYNSSTIEDIIRANDVRPYDGFIYFKKKGEDIGSSYDDKTINLDFCLGKVSSISEDSWVPKSDLSRSQERDMKLFPDMNFDKKKEVKHVFLRGIYKPVKFMSASISYVDSSTDEGKLFYFTHKGEQMYLRSIRISDGLGCYQERIGKHLNDFKKNY